MIAQEGSIGRVGNTITYSWPHVEPWCLWNKVQPPATAVHQLDFTLTFNRGWQQMQDAYSRLTHEWTKKIEKRFVYSDPFYQDLHVVAASLRGVAIQHGLNEVEVALSFVQSLAQSTWVPQRYAVETLIDGAGDCSDKAVLLAGIMWCWNHDYVFLGFPGHLAVGVWCNADHTGTYWESNGRRYFYCETNPAWQTPVGMTETYRNARADIRHPYVEPIRQEATPRSDQGVPDYSPEERKRLSREEYSRWFRKYGRDVGK